MIAHNFQSVYFLRKRPELFLIAMCKAMLESNNLSVHVKN